MNGEAVPEAERPGPETASLARNFLIIAIALLLLKLFLVSRDIVPERHDAEAYATASLYDLRLIFFDSAGHPPGAALVMGLARSLGIPYRIFIEVCLAAAAFLGPVRKQLNRVRGGGFPSLGSYPMRGHARCCSDSRTF